MCPRVNTHGCLDGVKNRSQVEFNYCPSVLYLSVSKMCYEWEMNGGDYVSKYGSSSVEYWCIG